MAATIRELRDEAWERAEASTLAYLASLEGDRPRVRPVAVVWWDGSAWIGSGTENGKTRQVRQNENVELCIPLEEGGRHGTIRLAGSAEIVTDDRTREILSEQMPYFSEYWTGPDDPTYSLIRIDPDEIVYLRPGEDRHSTIYL